MKDTDKTEEDKIKIPDNNFRELGGKDYEISHKTADLSLLLTDNFKKELASQQEKIEELEQEIERNEKTISNYTKSLKDEIKEKWDYVHKIKKQLSEKDKQIESLEKQLMDSRCCGNCGNEKYLLGDPDCDVYNICKTHVKDAKESHWKPRS